VLTGMGASYHALHPLHLQLTSKGATSFMVETSELLHYQSGILESPKTLIVVVSQSGQSAEIVRLLRFNRKRCPVVAITNTAESPLASQADAVILTEAGVEFSVSCKTYISALLALQWLGGVLLGDNLLRARKRLMRAGSVAHDYLATWQEKVRELTVATRGVQHIFLVGRGPSLAAAATGALIVKESTHCNAEGMSSAAFRHGPMEMVGKNTFVFVFSGERKTRSLNDRLVEDIRQCGGRADTIGEHARLQCCRIATNDSLLRPMLEILPVQMLTLALALAQDREPGRFARISKVTSTE
jgi:glutamine---fructose-6-phosphate transaminase (isomerizing)